MKTFRITVISLLLFVLPEWVFAQSYGNYEKVPFAIGLFPPISSNGTNAGNCVNQFSVNIISGYSAGLAGVEFAGFSNAERDFVRGAQFAGFGNFIAGEFTGFQFAGFGNFNRNVSNGFQFAGFSNFNYDQADGILAAGFANFTKGKSLAVQLAGFGNYCEDVEGVQGAGFANVVKGNGKAVQLAGFANITTGEVEGVQAAGFLNYSLKKMQNVQVAGFGNISTSETEGLQLAGFSNISTGNLKGVQISGFLNVANNVDGLQLGIVNIADTINRGVPVGLLSIVRNGFREFELSFSEGLNTQVAFKIGVDKFYNIFAAGIQFLGTGYSWAYGYGIGTHLHKTENSKTQLELMSYHINEGEAYTNVYNGLQQIRLTFTKKVGNHLGIFAGPTLNLLITDNREHGGTRFESDFAPYKMVSRSGKNTTLEGWLGVSAGIRIY
jgi:hypothetical protein